MIGKFELTFDTTLPEDESRMKEVCAVLAGFQVVTQEAAPAKPEPIVVPDEVVERMVEKVKEVTQTEVVEKEEAPTEGVDSPMPREEVQPLTEKEMMSMDTSALADILKQIGIDPNAKPGKNTNAKLRGLILEWQAAQNSETQEEQAETEEPEVVEEPVDTEAVEPMGYEEAKRLIAPLYSNNDLRPKIQQLIQAHGGKEEIDGVVKTKLSAIGERGEDYRPLVTEVLAKYGK